MNCLQRVFRLHVEEVRLVLFMFVWPRADKDDTCKKT